MTLQHTDRAKTKTALVMAGGTGGHIFPGLAVAQALRERGWDVHWLGAPGSMEERLVIPQGFTFEALNFGGLRGKGLATQLKMPWKLIKAIREVAKIIDRVQPQVLLGFGGYITFPGGLVGGWRKKPLILHEQNAIAGLANKVLSKFAKKVFTTFPKVLAKGEYVGNPLRQAFTQQPSPEQRYKERDGVLRLLVVGGSLGAKTLNRMVPQALALMDSKQRPCVLHQSGEKQIGELRCNYSQAGVEAELTPFIEDAAKAYSEADVVIARAGASTVTELAAVGAPALLVPFPYAVDDHQTANAQFLVQEDAAWLVQEKDLTAQKLAEWLLSLNREDLLKRAQKAQSLAKLDAVEHIVQACEEVVAI